MIAVGIDVIEAVPLDGSLFRECDKEKRARLHGLMAIAEEADIEEVRKLTEELLAEKIGREDKFLTGCVDSMAELLADAGGPLLGGLAVDHAIRLIASFQRMPDADLALGVLILLTKLAQQQPKADGKAESQGEATVDTAE